MFYRVDYVLTVLVLGFLSGLLISKPTQRVTTLRLARTYYIVIALLVVLRAVAFACTMLSVLPKFWKPAGGITSDLLSFLFGALFGPAIRRRDTRTVLSEQCVLNALCMMLAFTFALAGIGKAFSIAPMTEFFTQSGYSVTFLKFIVFAEIFGSLGLLLPWALPFALTGLIVDMFGAVLTHIHNGDPLNDSSGAIGMLIRVLLVGLSLATSPKSGTIALYIPYRLDRYCCHNNRLPTHCDGWWSRNAP